MTKKGLIKESKEDNGSKDANSEDATFAIDSLSEDLEGFARDGEYDWYIDDATED